MSLTTNIKKSFDQYFRQELGLEVKATGQVLPKDKEANASKKGSDAKQTYITEE